MNYWKLLLGVGALVMQTPLNNAFAQEQKVYQATATIEHALKHTKLDAKFDYDRQYLMGKVWLTLQPHYYASNAVSLDAKGMDIKLVGLNNANTPLKYSYDGMVLKVQLNKTYQKTEPYTLYIEYVAKPNELKVKGSAAITDAKGLYFINPKGIEKNKPTQIWTQGETEATSVWVPTIDRPNQKTTQEISMTVPAKYVTLSNGIMVSQKKNQDGTRTDTWKMNLPHAPYLFFMGVGDFAVIKDSYKGKEVAYYVEPAYANAARKIFGDTPEMMAFFSKITGVEYPWPKYAQIVGRDYVSGAMENTTATLHQETAQQNLRQLTDQNVWEDVVAHELFHHWFGDYVTAESWSNLTVNESFANYSEVLWREHKYGKDAALDHHKETMMGYLQSGSENKHLVRFDYNDKEDMFDAVSYNKGGCILHMLRHHIGDSAFFNGIGYYLKQNKFGTGEAHQLRLALEAVSGQDLNWFFNQWYYNNGHPKLNISRSYDDKKQKAYLIVEQTQTGKPFRIPLQVMVHFNDKGERVPFVLEHKIDTLTVDYKNGYRPTLINFDADKMILAEIKDKKSDAEYQQQWKYAQNYLDRLEALTFVLDNLDEPNNKAILKEALKDKYEGIRKMALEELSQSAPGNINEFAADIKRMAEQDSKKLVRAAAIDALSKTKNNAYIPLFEKAINDSSYSVAGAGLAALKQLAPEQANQLAKGQIKDAKGRLGSEITAILMSTGTADDFEFIYNGYKDMAVGQAKFEATPKFLTWLNKVDNEEQVKQGVSEVVAFRNMIPSNYESIKKMINNWITDLANTKAKAGKQSIADAIKKML